MVLVAELTVVELTVHLLVIGGLCAGRSGLDTF